ncbi:nucleotidyltransferase family protein [Pseudoalteromonas byunsanensis]|uniref:Nucleotidyltransferase n=1 Tax=Pseudoalteromonas byunsanensis TaxID=327939 RepID=A0A1S1N758_9GAMM|nr:nucleotidyltransferase family protein [Pseudoalteromonas byunsanensis]OHU95200.1 hypothetical protein BIW53_10770 [Pseudoalteromonas byunsanensis]
MNLVKELFNIYWSENYSFQPSFSYSDDHINGLVELAAKHKVLPYLLKFFDKNQINYQLSEGCQAIVDKFNYERSAWLTFLQMMNKSSEFDYRYVVLKGLTFESYYPDDRERFCLDMDIVACAEDVFWQVMNVALCDKFVMPGMFQLFKSQQDEHLEGLAKFGLDYEHIVGGIEVHLRRFQLTDDTFLHWSMLSEFAVEKMQVAGVTLYKPNTAVSLVTYLSEMVTRDEVNIRDGYDALRLFSVTYNEQEIKYITQMVSVLGLEPVLLRIRAFFKQFDSTEPALLMSILPSQFSDSVDALSHHYQRFYEQYTLIRRIKYRSVYWLRRLMDRLAEKDSLLWLLRLTDKSAVTQWMFNQGFPIFCLPVDAESQELNLPNKLKIGDFQLRCTGGMCFIFAANAIVTDDDLDMVEQALAQGAI